MQVVRKLVALLWILVPPIVFSALIHTSDADVDGWSGLDSYSVLFSVLFFGLVAASVFYCCLATLLRTGWPLFLVLSCLFSILIGGLLAVFGSGSTTVLGRTWTFIASTGLTFVTVALAVLPSALFGWRKLGFYSAE
jgi:hypothetical protein